MSTVSIIVLVYNVASYLPQCLDSIINQTYRDLEIILIDDGSTDCSGDICDAYAERDSRVKVIHPKNSGIAQVRLNGFSVSSGSFVMFVDGDDYIDVKAVELMVKAQREYDVDVVSCQYYDVLAGRKVASFVRPKPGRYDKACIIKLLKENFLFDKKMRIAGMTGFLCSRLIKRDFVMEALQNGLGLIHSEDQIGIFCLLCRIDSMYVMEDRLYYYIRREGQATQKYDPRYWNNFDIYFERLQKMDSYGYLKDQLSDRALLILRMLIRMELDNQSVSWVSRIGNIKRHFDSSLYDLAAEENREQTPMKEKVQNFLLQKKWVTVYAILVFINSIRKRL